MARKSKADTVIDIISDIASGKGLDLDDVSSLATGGSSSSKKKSSSSKKKSDGGLIDRLMSGDDNYPQMSEKTYWAVREKFQRSIPEKVIASTLTSATGLKAESVKSSVLPALNAMGLIKDDGKPTGTLTAWANDSKYADACEKIREKIYPNSLNKMECGTKTEQNAVVKWFMKNADVSETTAKKMAAVFFLLTTAELKKAKSDSKSTSKSASAKKSSSDDEIAEIKSGVTVSKKGSKATIIYKVSVSENITKTELREKFEDALEKAFKKIRD